MNGKIKKMLSAVSITLCATVGLSLPVDVVAATLPKTETQYSSFDNIVGENPEESKIVKELTGERTENSKEFLLEDGTKMTAQYNEPVHYKDSKGKWVEYNNTLSEDKTASPRLKRAILHTQTKAVIFRSIFQIKQSQKYDFTAIKRI